MDKNKIKLSSKDVGWRGVRSPFMENKMVTVHNLPQKKLYAPVKIAAA